MSKVKIAMIGAGNIANVHINAYKAVADAEVYALCDINEARLNETGDKYGISRRYTDVDTMLKDLPELDAADVCVWNCNHAECAIKALDAGLHVLCEKPMAYNVEQAQAMLDAAERNKRLLMIGFVCRFEKPSLIAKDFIDNDYLGDIYYTKLFFTRRHGNPGGWFADKSMSGGGPVIDLAVHSIDLIRYLMGNPKPVSVYAVTYDKLGKRDHLKNGVSYILKDKSKDVCTVEDFASAMIKYEDGSVTYMETSYSLNGPDEYKQILYGTKGGMEITDKVKIYTEYNNYLADIDVCDDKIHGLMEFEGEMAHFVDCVKNGTECKAPAKDGFDIMKILDAIYKSAETGHEVIL